MRMLVRLVLGLFVLKAVSANPRFSRQLDLYDNGNYGVEEDNFEDTYDYDDGLTVDESETETETQNELDYNYPPEDLYEEEKVEEEEEEAAEEHVEEEAEEHVEEEEEVVEHVEEEEEELPLKPQLVPQGSGGSGVLMGPETQKEVELRRMSVDTLHVSGDFGGSVGSGASGASGASEASGASGASGDSGASGASGASGDSGASGASGASGDPGASGDSRFSGASGASSASGSESSGDILVSGASGSSGDIILVSGASEELISSGGSGEFLLSGDILISGDFPGSGYTIGSGSGDIIGSGSGDIFGSGSGDIIGSGSGDTTESGISGFSGDATSGEYGIVTELPIGSGGSGDQSGSGISGDLLISGGSGISGVSGDLTESGQSGITLISGEDELTLDPETHPQEVSGVSEEISGASGTSGASGDIDTSGGLEVSGTSGTSGVSSSGDIDVSEEVTLLPEPDEEEELLPTPTQPSQEGKTSIEETVSSGEPEEPDEEVVDAKGMPVCLLCTCLGGSVYCDDLKLDGVPPLPKDTTHFYARYNKITKINKSDFTNLNKLKRIDLTANEIASIDDRAFMGIPELEELIVRENHIRQLPALPETMTLIDASHNDIDSKGIHKEAFKDMTALLYLYLTDNNIDYIPVPLPDSLRSLHLQRNNIQMMHEDTFCNLNDFNYIRNALEDIRLDGNPINLSKTPQAYICLPRIPIGNLI